MTREHQLLRKQLQHMNPITAYNIGVDEGLHYALALVLWEIAERKDENEMVKIDQAFLSDVASDLERDSRSIAAHTITVDQIKSDLLHKHGIRLDLR